MLVFLITGLLMVAGAGAGAFALARADSPPTMVQPYGPDAPFGVGYVDGFGEHSPKPEASPLSRKATPASLAAPASARLPAAPSGGRAPSGSAGARPTAPTSTIATRISAVAWTRAADGRFDTYMWVHNEGSVPATWQVRVRLPQGATLTGATAVTRTSVGGAWVFKPIVGELRAGMVYLFGFSGTTGSSRFSLNSCTVNDSPCDIL